MGQITNLRNVIGIIKDKASQGKAAIVSDSLHLSLLKATSHDPFTPPNSKHIATFLSFGRGSRATAATVIEAIMDRLQSTRDAIVAVKSLLVVHHIIKRGSFILQDQLSVYPASGGRNHLKLSNFRDNTSSLTWELSSWVRWYARYLETLLSTSRILGFFLCSTSSTMEKEREEEKVSAITNHHLLKEIDSLVGLVEEIRKRPECLHIHLTPLIDSVLSSVGDDYLSAVNDISVRVNEVNERLSSLSFSDSYELVCIFKRIEGCREKLTDFSNKKKAMTEGFWGMMMEMKDVVGGSLVDKDGGRLLLEGKVSESARFSEVTRGYGDSSRFHSTRFGVLNR